jgi:hypothetical protein
MLAIGLLNLCTHDALFKQYWRNAILACRIKRKTGWPTHELVSQLAYAQWNLALRQIEVYELRLTH